MTIIDKITKQVFTSSSPLASTYEKVYLISDYIDLTVVAVNGDTVNDITLSVDRFNSEETRPSSIPNPANGSEYLVSDFSGSVGLKSGNNATKVVSITNNTFTHLKVKLVPAASINDARIEVWGRRIPK